MSGNLERSRRLVLPELLARGRSAHANRPPINFRLAADEIAYILNDSGAVALIAQQGRRASAAATSSWSSDRRTRPQSRSRAGAGEHPAVADVAAIGVHHSRWVESPVAFVLVAAGRPMRASRN